MGFSNEVLKNLPHNLARDAYNIAEGVLERRDAIVHKWALTEALIFDGIEKLHLTVRSERCLKADEVYTLSQLLNCTKDRLLKTVVGQTILKRWLLMEHQFLIT